MRINSIRNFNFFKLNKRDNKSASYSSVQSQPNTTNPFSANPFFTGFQCSTDAFLPRKLFDIPCASCGKTTLQPKQIDNFVKTVQDLKGEALVKALQKKNALYRPFEAKIVQKICATALEYPEYDLNAIIHNLSEKSVDELKTSQYAIFNKIRKVTKKLKFKEREEVEEYLNKQEKLISNPDYEKEQYFKRLDFINGLITVGKNIKQVELYKQILLLADQIPSSSNSESAFYVSYARKQNDEIARRLIALAGASTEHMLPVSRGGKNESSNYIVMCSSCNSNRSNMSYPEWLKTMPNMVKNFNNYLSEIVKRIDAGELGLEYLDYPKEAHDTFEEQLGQAIEPLAIKPEVEAIDIEENLEDSEEVFLARIEFLENLYKEREKDLEELKAKAKILTSDPRFVLYKELNEKEVVLNGFKISRKEIEKKKDELQKRVTSFERRKKRLEELQKELERNADNPKAQAETREKIRKITYDKEKHQEAIDRLEALRAKSEKQLQAIRAKEEEIGNIRKKLKFPEDYIEEERSLDSQVQRRKDLKTKILLLKRQQNTYGASSMKASEILARIDAIDAELKKLDVAPFEIENSEEVKKYQELELKLDYLETRYEKEIARNGAESKMLASILEEAKENIITKMQNMANVDRVVKAYTLDQEKQVLEVEVKTSFDMEDKKNNIENEIKSLEGQLENLLLVMSDEELSEKIAKIKKEKDEISEIMKNLDIEEKIISSENQLKSLFNSISKLRKKKYSLDYKKQAVRENLVGALRNIETVEEDKPTDEN